MIVSNCKSLFFYFFVTELILCGSGQIIHLYGGLTLRMFNFIIAVFLSILFFTQNTKMDEEPTNIFLFYTITFFLGVALSFIGCSTNNLFSDVKPLSFFFVFPFFYRMFQSENVVLRIVQIIKYCVIVMTIIYLLYLVLMRVFNLLDFYAIYYGGMNEESDFLFRGTGGELFYKGFVYLPIGLVFLLNSKRYILSVLVLLAIYFTLTRGFYVISFVAIFLAYLLYSKQSSLYKILLLIVLLLMAIFVSSYFSLFQMGESRDAGDQLRVLTIYQVIERITPFSMIFGHGFGNGVPIREVHMEMSYLEIFHKQGVLGLSFWLYLLHCIYNTYRHIGERYKRLGSAFLISAILVYVQSLFNPFLNNPIGMTAVLLSYFSCRQLVMLSHASDANKSYY